MSPGVTTAGALAMRSRGQARGGTTSRYEIVRVLAVTPDVAVAQVRRVALDPAGHPFEPAAAVAGAFSEMALYVLVHRDRMWWVAAGQNTLIRPGPPDSQAHVAGERDE
jgi:hypothetical protein